MTLENDDLEDVVDLSTEHEEAGEDRGDALTDAPEAEEAPAEVEQEQEPEQEGEQRRSASVPHARFHEVNEAKKAAEQRAAELEAEIERLRSAKPAPHDEKPAAKPEEFDVSAKEEEAAQALFEGDTKKYREIQDQIRAYTEDRATRRAFEQFEQITAQRTAQSLLQATADRIASEYAFLNSQAPEANPDAIADVLEWRDYYHAVKGQPLHTALENAVKKIAPLYQRSEPEVDEPPAPKTDARRAAAVARAAASAAAQPPNLGGIGERAAASKLDVEKMTDDQYAKLSDEEKRRLRGD